MVLADLIFGSNLFHVILEPMICRRFRNSSADAKLVLNKLAHTNWLNKNFESLIEKVKLGFAAFWKGGIGIE